MFAPRHNNGSSREILGLITTQKNVCAKLYGSDIALPTRAQTRACVALFMIATLVISCRKGLYIAECRNELIRSDGN